MTTQLETTTLEENDMSSTEGNTNEEPPHDEQQTQPNENATNDKGETRDGGGTQVQKHQLTIGGRWPARERHTAKRLPHEKYNYTDDDIDGTSFVVLESEDPATYEEAMKSDAAH